MLNQNICSKRYCIYSWQPSDLLEKHQRVSQDFHPISLHLRYIQITTSGEKLYAMFRRKSHYVDLNWTIQESTIGLLSL